MGFYRQDYLSGYPFSSPGDLPNSEIKQDSLLFEPPGKFIFKVFIEFVTTLLLFYVLFFLSARSVGSKLHDQGSNLHLLH